MKLTNQMKRIDGVARSRLEPVKPEPGFPTESQGYARCLSGGNGVPWLVYCRPRYDWLIREMTRRGISMADFGRAGNVVPRKTCRRIASKMREMLRQGETEDYEGDRCLESEIPFWAHCGGVRIHEWGHYFYQDND